MPPNDPMTPQRLKELALNAYLRQLTNGECLELRAHADQLERNAEDARKVRAFNLLLTSVNLTVRHVAERYLEGVKDYEAFVEYLRKQPKPAPLQDADIDEDCR